MINLLTDAWIPVRKQAGTSEFIAPWQIPDPLQHYSGLVAPRPDFNGALIQFLIGLVQTAAPPDDKYAWLDAYDQPPSPEMLRERFLSLENAFELGGTNARFMQDLTLTDGEAKPISALLIEAPGGNTLKNNQDHFIKRDTVSGMCPRCAATALYTLQTNAPSGGVGHRVSLRGGGPLTTLVMGETLWQTVWLNVLPREVFDQKIVNENNRAQSDIFPWLASTHTSENGQTVTPADVHPAQMFWAMPRRIRLDLDHVQSGACGICGERSESLVTRYLTKNYGISYTGWEHTLTPHTRDTEGVALPRHGQPGCVTYRHWLGLVQKGEDDKHKREPALVVHYFTEHLFRDLRKQAPMRLWAFGYDTDNMKAVCWYDSTMPLYPITPEQRGNWEVITESLISATDFAANNLKRCVKNALFGKIKEVGKTGAVKWEIRNDSAKKDASLFENLNDGFWQALEGDFYSTLKLLAEHIERDRKRIELLREWHRLVCNMATQQFDATVYSGAFEEDDPKRIAVARRELKRWNQGNRMQREILRLPE